MIYSYFKDSSFTAINRDANFYKEFVKGVPFVNRRYMNACDGGTFAIKNGVHRPVEPPRIKLCRVPPGKGQRKYRGYFFQ